MIPIGVFIPLFVATKRNILKISKIQKPVVNLKTFNSFKLRDYPNRDLIRWVATNFSSEQNHTKIKTKKFVTAIEISLLKILWPFRIAVSIEKKYPLWQINVTSLRLPRKIHSRKKRLKKVDGSTVGSVFHPSDVDQIWVREIPGESVGKRKLSLRSG